MDIDDDNDGSWDTNETTCGTDPLDSLDSPIDTDSDGTCNGADTDDDDDGVLDADEAASFIGGACSLVYDCDGDGVSDYNETDGSALDLDDDGTADGIHCAASTDCDGGVPASSAATRRRCAAWAMAYRWGGSSEKGLSAAAYSLTLSSV